MPKLLPLNLQFFADEPTDDWESVIDAIDMSDDNQPETELEETVEETEEEVTEHEVEPDSDEVEEEVEEETEEETESEEVEEVDTLSDDAEIALGEESVTFKELKDGYLRQSDYTKKTQALANDRKELEALQEEYEPIKEWTEYWANNPYLKEQILGAIQQWENTGVLPIEQVLQNTSSGQYINQLMREKLKLEQEVARLTNDVTTTKFDSEMTKLENDLKEEYGELADAEYLTSLREQATEQGIAMEVLKRIADGDLAKKQLEQEKQNSKKAVAKAKQKQKSKVLPPQPKSKGQTPREVPKQANSWEDFFGVE